MAQQPTCVVLFCHPQREVARWRLDSPLKTDQLNSTEKHPKQINVNRNGRQPRSLLAAYYTSGIETYLREAMEDHPNEPRVALAAASEAKAQGQTEEYRQWLNRFEAAAPENALPNYLLASDYMGAGQTEQGLQELRAATSKSKLDLYSLDFAQSCEEAYLSAGYPEIEAEAAGMANPRGLNVIPTLKWTLIDIADSYKLAGDADSAQAVLEMGLTLGQRFAEPSPMASIVQTLFGANFEGEMINGMDPGSRLGRAELAAKAESDALNVVYTRMMAENINALMRSISAEDQPGYLDCFKNSGQLAAIQWLESKQGQPRPH